jgi:hypothetical protein
MKFSANKTAVTFHALNEPSPLAPVPVKGSQASPAASQSAVDLESKAREAALVAFIASVQQRFEARFPGIAYDGPQYDFRLPSGQTDSKGQRLNWQQVHQTKVKVSKPDLVEGELSALHPSFALAARAIVADRVLQNRSKLTDQIEYGLRLLSYLAFPSEQARAIQPLHLVGLTLYDLAVHHLKHIERCVLTACLTPQTAKAFQLEKLSLDHLIVPGVEMRGMSAFSNRTYLIALYAVIAVLQKAKVISPMNARLTREVGDLLLAIEKHQATAFRKGKAAELEPGIAALSDAITALADGDPRLSEIQQAALCVMGLEMCAPSRINEVMAMSIHDRLRAVDAYEQEPGENGGSMAMTESKALHRGHAGIKEVSVPNALNSLPNTVLMKGSMGAAWGPQPVLDFMLVMFNWCVDHMIEMGSRSRMLLEHYEKHPTTLYLPPELEYLRGKPLTRIQIGRIMLLDADLGIDEETFKVKARAAMYMASHVQFNLVKSGLTFTLAQRPDQGDQIVGERARFIEAQAKKAPVSSNSATKANARKTSKLQKTDTRTQYAQWSSVEAELLRRVHETMDSIRWVTHDIQYKGRLSNMLMLFDYLGGSPAYLPGALSGRDVSRRLKSQSQKSKGCIQTVFEALDLTMPVLSEDGTKVEIVPAYCRSHDPRRWLTTMALRHAGPELSRLLINLWANRADVGQLNAYDYSSPEEKASLTAQDVPQAMVPALLNQHDDLSLVLKDELISDYKLQTQSISVGLHAVRVTTMDDIHAAESNHPVAKAGDKLILVFPTPYGVCLHQHHEAGCTNYRGCGGACSDQRVIKGHLPTNEQVRKQANKLHDVIVAQVRRLILARNRKVVHDLDKLDEHLGRMIQQHMDAEDISARLIDGFLEIKDFIKDAAFKADLEDAYAFKGKVERLDDPEVRSGAVIRYYNPERNGRPEAERTVEALGGRKALEQEVKTFLEGRDYMRLENRAANDVDAVLKNEYGEDDRDDAGNEDDA